MAGILTAEEQAFLDKMEQRRLKRNENQIKYRSAHKDKIAEYNKSYNESLKAKQNAIISKQPQPTAINIQQIAQEPIKIDKRTRRGKKHTTEIQPFYKKRTEPLEYSTINTYISQLDILNRFFT